MSIANNAGDSGQNKYFNLGVEHASTTYSAMCGHIKNDDTNPVLLQAKSLVKERRNINIKVPKFLKTLHKSKNSSIGAAVIELTIKKHIKNKYP